MTKFTEGEITLLADGFVKLVYNAVNFLLANRLISPDLSDQQDTKPTYVIGDLTREEADG